MKVAIVGSSGYIAGYLRKRLSKNTNIDEILKIDQIGATDVYLDLLRADEFDYSYIDDIDVVIFTAAISGPDKCSNEFEKCWKINVDGTSYFIRKTLEKKKKVIFFSSDATYGDIKGGKIYDENSETNPITPYGKMKKAIEEQFKGNPFFKAIRLSYVVSANDRFVSYCLECIKNNETAEVFHPFYRNCICVNDVVDTVEWLVFNWNRLDNYVLNVTGAELVSRVRIADEINRIMDNKLNYKIIYPGDDFYKNRPQTTQMTSRFLWKYNIIENNSFTEKIKKELEEI